MKWLKKVIHYIFDGHISLVKSTIVFEFKTVNGYLLMSHHVPVKFKKGSLICLDVWHSKDNLLKELEKKNKENNNKTAKILLKNIRKSGYHSRDTGVFVKGKHIVECSWDYYYNKWEGFTYDEWQKENKNPICSDSN